MTTFAALQRKTATLEQETRRRYPYPGRGVLEDWTAIFTGDEREQLEAFLESIKPHLETRDNGALDLTRLTDDELDQLHRWAILSKQREQGGSKEK